MCVYIFYGVCLFSVVYKFGCEYAVPLNALKGSSLVMCRMWH